MGRGLRGRLVLVFVAALLWATPMAAGSPAGSVSPSAGTPGTSAAPGFRLVSYNILRIDAEPADRLIAALAARAPAVVGLVEVTDERAQVLAADEELARLYPYRELRPFAAGGGLALLSSYPIAAEPDDPVLPVLVATVELEGGEIAVVVAHADNPLRSPDRDAQLMAMRTLVLGRATTGLPAVLAGDLNTNPFEPVFWRLTEGLVDTGSAPTWGPDPDGPVLLRIDHVIVTPDLGPVSLAVDCEASASDHCLLDAHIGLPAG